jgi:hypothetical protein
MGGFAMTAAQSHDDMLMLLTEMGKATVELKRQADATEALVKALNEIVVSLNFQKASIPPQKPLEDSSKGPLRPRDTTPSGVNWRPFKTGTPGGWCYANENKPLHDTLLAAQKKTVVLENYTYRLSGDDDKFIQRFPVGPKK